MTSEEIQTLQQTVKAAYPTAYLAFMKENSYCGREEDIFTIWHGNNILCFVPVRIANAECIILLIKTYLHAYELAQERTEERIRDQVMTMFKLQPEDED